ncbi:heme-binding domain-containing protein [Sungkyunkwania multivorans]|uniref:Heme-binding domain-containing protein n=1 Tax=Sungkyunkwania multivorans TaxID=1173618 RepID=A0ABW3CXA9_9FLAO
MKIVKKILVALLIIFVVMQFIRPEKNIDSTDHLSAFIQETKPSAEVENILKKACYDCHSNHTVYPWYAEVAPVSYWLDDHIEHGKGHLNFSAWDTYSVKKKDHKMEEVIEYVENRWMPLNSYTWGHAEAKLTDEQIQTITDWAKALRLTYQLADRPQ